MSVLKKLLGRKKRRKAKASPYSFERKQPTEVPSEDRQTIAALNLLDYTKTSGTAYAADGFPAGYHEIQIGDRVYGGQRKPAERLEASEIDFTGKTVLDVGSNQGGMLFAIADKVRWAVGLDYDPKMVNASNKLRRIVGADRVDFFVFDIDSDPHGLIEDFLPEERVDVVFLLSVCMWVDRWRDLIDTLAAMSDQMLFESNGSPDQQTEQVSYLQSCYGDVKLLRGQSSDDPKKKARRLYLCNHPV